MKSIKEKLLAKAKKKVVRFLELQELVSDPKVIANSNQYRDLTKEMAALTPLVQSYKAYEEAAEEITKVKHLIEEGESEDLTQLAQDELKGLLSRQDELQQKMEEAIFSESEGVDRNIIIEIRGGTGGLEAALFAGDLFRMYSKYASRKAWRIETLSSSPGDKGGFKEVVFSVAGRGAYGAIRFESGTHRVQRVPETETSGRIHTSAATVAVMPEPEELEVVIEPKDLKIDVFRAGGRGGQHVNVTDSAVRITHIPTGLVVSCQDERSQHKNKSKGMRVLRARLADKIQDDHHTKMSEERKVQVGSGDRSEKIRTYNFPQNRVTDHRINFTLHSLEDLLEGDMDELVDALKKAEREVKLKKILESE